MSDSIHINFNKKDVDEFIDILHTAERETNRKMPNLVKQATIWTTQSLAVTRKDRRLTPISKRRRKGYKLKKTIKFKNGKTKTYKYVIVHYKGNKKKGIPKGKIGFWHTNKLRGNSRLKIRFRGAARAGWVGVLRKMGKGSSRPEGGRKMRQIMHQASRFRKGGGQTQPFMEIANLIRYIGIIAPYSVGLALKKTGNRLVKQMERDLDRLGFS